MARQDGPGNGEGKRAQGQRARRGFSHAGLFLKGQIGRATAKRGLTETRLVTEWAEIVGPEAGAATVPVRISHAGRQLGGTLLLRAAPGRGPEVEMMAPQIVERVNACFGYRAVGRLRLTQEMAPGFAEAARGFDLSGAPAGPSGEDRERIAGKVATVAPPDLRAALERLGLAIAARGRRQDRKERQR